MNMVIFYGSVRSARVGIRAARYLVAQCEARGYATTLIDPLEYELPLLDKMYKEYEPGEAPEPLETIAEHIRRADAFLVVSGEYNHSIPPALSNLLDHFLEEYFWRPSAIASYSGGAFGGVRAAMQLRALLGEIGMPSISSILPFPKVQELFDEAGNLQGEGTEKVERSTKRFLDELAWHADALKSQREKGTPY
jgi:NAD(P)H-dependent FMN reductase